MSHAVLVKYLRHNAAGCRIALTGSCIAYRSNRDYEFYHVCKLSMLRFAALHGLLIANPPTIRGSGFFRDMPRRTGLRRLGTLKLFSVSVEGLARAMLHQMLMGQKVLNVGVVTWAACIAQMLSAVK